MVAIAILLVALLLTDSATPPCIGIPIAGLPEPSPYDTGTAYYRRCMGVNSRAGWGRNCGGRRPRRRASASAHGERGQTAPDAVGYGSQNVLRSASLGTTVMEGCRKA